jgi:DNA replication protein DnaC
MISASEPQTATRSCQRHGEYEARVFTIAGRTIASGCQACAAEADETDRKRQQREAAARAAARIETLLQRSGIPQRFKDRDFDGYQAETEGQARALRIARSYADQWPEMRRRGTCLIFSGEPGTGKTHLACAIANAVIRQGGAALFITVGDAMRSIKRAYDRDAGISESDAIETLVGPDLLILDEVGADYGTEHSKALLFDLLNKRYEQVRPTLVLTNLDAASLREYFGERVMDRLREDGGRFIPFDWQSYRAKRKDQA